MKVALLQLNVTDTPADNLPVTLSMVRDAAAQGAAFVLTPEMTNCISLSRTHQNIELQHEADDITLAALRDEARALGIWLSIGSLGLKTTDEDERFANRSFLISPQGDIVARYDKIHMFDVDVSPTETFRESDGYRAGNQAVLAEMNGTMLGLTICYDLRFAYLHRALANKGAEILLIPAAFSPETGVAHWEPLLRARAIETGCFVLAAAQTGTHAARSGRARSTYGHSMAISPWGQVMADAGTDSGITVVDLDLKEVAQARQRIAALTHDRDFEGP